MLFRARAFNAVIQYISGGPFSFVANNRGKYGPLLAHRAETLDDSTSTWFGCRVASEGDASALKYPRCIFCYSGSSNKSRVPVYATRSTFPFLYVQINTALFIRRSLPVDR